MWKLDLNYYYYYFTILRIILVLIPQTGYIHPDEYFQSVEILAGKVFDVETSPPWEFNTTTPIRSMAIPYFTIGMSYKLLRDVNDISTHYFSISIVTPYSLLVVPRLLMCFLSFIVDYCLYKICINNNEMYKSRLLIYSSSYIVLIYNTRTFTNSFETILFSLLLYFVSESQTFSNILNKKRDYLSFRYANSKSVTERAHLHKIKLYLASDSLRNCFLISTITVLGFFNRPTFVAFGIIPVFFWLNRGVRGRKTITTLQLHIRILFFLTCCVPSILILIIVDSFFYGYLTWGEIGMFDISHNNFVITPINFIKYNLDSSNLAKHGIHPRFLHALVNVPLLFSILGIYLLSSILKYLSLCLQGKLHLLPSIRSIKCLMHMSFITPVAILSIFPHQEPRFLVPLILPITYLNATDIIPESQNAVVEIRRASTCDNVKLTSHKNGSNYLFTFWVIINTLLMIFYGFVHQGGVYQVTEYLHRDLSVTSMKTDYLIVTSHIYSLPESFLLQSRQVGDKFKEVYDKRVYLYELGSTDLNKVLEQIKHIHSRIQNKNDTLKTYLIITSSLVNDLNKLLVHNNLNYTVVERFFPHFSAEALPDLTKYCPELYSQLIFSSKCSTTSLSEYFRYYYSSFQLILYQIPR